MKIGRFDLTPWQWTAGVLLAGPPVVSVLLQIGPGRWLNAVQDALLGGHSSSLSLLAAMAMEFACISVVAVVVRRIAGRTVVQLLRGLRPG